MQDKLNIALSTHPDFYSKSIDWGTFRAIKEGGTDFVDEFLVKFSSRESDADFKSRKSITPIAGFAAAALVDVKNAIFQRLSDTSRVGGSDTYQKIIKGELGGVDRASSTMDNFVGTSILPELIFMGRVGIYLDMPSLSENQTKQEASQAIPYAYCFRTEQIRNWVFTPSREGVEFEKLLLEETHLSHDQNFGLPLKEEKKYRLLTKEDGVVTVRFFNAKNQQIDINNEPTDQPIVLNITRIPFVLLELDRSLLQDIATHQIALTNLESADIAFALKSNAPFYTEQQSGLQGSHLKSEEGSNDHEGDDISTGAIEGRRYSKGLERPGFIHPSPEPLKASIEKQDHLKSDIRTLINLAASAIRPKYASAASKNFDNQGLEAGLSFLGLVLEHAERQLASIWQEYQGEKETITINYPERYSLKTNEDRINEAKLLGEQMATVPSRTYQKVVAKQIAHTLFDAKVSNETITKILEEIDDAEYISSDPQSIHEDIERGILSLETAAKARGYNKDEPQKAAKDHAERIARIKMAQEAPDSDPDSDSQARKLVKQESQNPDIQEHGQKATRGESK